MHSHDHASSIRFGRSMLLVASIMLAIAGTAFAQALDPPQLTQTGGGFFRIDIDVAAGASGAPHGFVIQWMKKSDYEAFGFPADEYDPRAAYCDFIGVPTLNTDDRSSSYLLDPNGVIRIQMGDLFDETGVDGTYLDQVIPGDYAFHVWAAGDGVNPGRSEERRVGKECRL